MLSDTGRKRDATEFRSGGPLDKFPLRNVDTNLVGEDGGLLKSRLGEDHGEILALSSAISKFVVPRRIGGDARVSIFLIRYRKGCMRERSQPLRG
jgi:hypothetical protein